VTDLHDVLVLGGGPGGMSCALWLRALGMRPLLLESAAETGGQLHRIHRPVTDYLGVPASTGAEIHARFRAHLDAAGVEVRCAAPVEALDAGRLRARVAGAWLQARHALVIATGVRARKLGLPEETSGERGVYASYNRNPEGFRGKPAVVVGGGDAAFENALFLCEVSPRVTLVHRGARPRARPEMVERLRKEPRAQIIENAVVRRVDAEGGEVRAVEIAVGPGGEARTVPAGAVLVKIGNAPNTEFLRDPVELDADGYVIVDAAQQTRAPGIYAVGEVANRTLPRIATAAAEGARAAWEIAQRLTSPRPAAR
jgi:thioredoxin reductase (NADPH)